ncbi:MAG: phenylacetate-CoA oxygenase/reductase subunit PaaK [Sphingobacteriia bacterium]|nr:MAG: phenylacetate-CoA oxygenase/reductase subunit PaaK [Sphingobacteriia bacterium]
MNHFETLTIKDIRRETNDCVSIAFDLQESASEQFKFTQGQYITLKTNINGESVRRSYSICSSPLEKELRVAIKKVPGGIFSSYANEVLQIGDTLEVMPPNGKFYTPLSAENKNKYIAFASGSGITPIISIIKTTLQTEVGSSFTLVYGNKNRHSIIFKEQLEALKNTFMGRLSIVYILSREKTDAAIHFGRIDANKAELLCNHLIEPLSAAGIFLCGPSEMIFGVKEHLEKIGVAPKKIHFELFGVGEKQKSTSTSTSSSSQEVKSKITIQQDGVAFDFELGFEGESILEAALKHGADLPFACKGGVCCTCKAKLIEGEVDMDVNYGLEQEEIEHGFILTCQSHPRTEKIVIDFDTK